MTRFKYDAACARAVVALGLLYMLNAFVQSTDWLTVPELVIGAIWLGTCAVIPRWLNAWGIVAVSFVASIAWALIVDSQPVSDFLGFHRRAAGVADGDLGQLLDTKSPPTVAYYAAFQALFGSSYASNYVAGAFAWSAGALMIYKAALRWVIDERHARFVCACVALYPSFVVFAVVPSSETIVFLLTGTGAWLLSRAIGSSGGRKTGIAALLGLTIGVLYLARMNSLILLFPCMVLLVLANSDQGVRAPRQAFATTLPLVALAASVAAVIVAFGLVFALEKGDFRASPPSKGEILLLFGTNTETQGGFNRADFVLAGYESADPDVRDAAPTTARRMAFERVTDDLPRFAVFASTTKIERLWGTERPLNSYSIGDPEDREQVAIEGGLDTLRDAHNSVRAFAVAVDKRVISPDDPVEYVVSTRTSLDSESRLGHTRFRAHTGTDPSQS